MELGSYVETLQRDLAAAAAPAGPDVERVAHLLAGSLDVSARMCLLEALSDAAAEITTKLSHATVEVRLRGREAQLVVAERAVAGPAADPSAALSGADARAEREPETGDVARLTLRLPESLKEAVERAAAAESISVNAWLVRAITRVVAGTHPPDIGAHPGNLGGRAQPRGRLGRHVTGFAQA